MKLFSCAFLVAVLVGCLTLTCVSSFGVVYASTNVNGIFSSDTTWTKADSPYSLTGNVLVSNGVTLTIEAGAIINLNDFYIMVNGTLRAQGTETDKIVFYGNEITFTDYSSNWNEQTDTGSIIENANLRTTNIFIVSASPKIVNNSILRLSVKGSALISNNEISDSLSILSDSPTISYNTVFGNVGCHSNAALSFNNLIGGLTISQRSPEISNNTISCGVNISGGSPIISNNDISGGLKVVGINSGSITSPQISHNTISGDVVLRSADGVCAVTNNKISGKITVFGRTAIISKNTLDQGIDLVPCFLGTIHASISSNTIRGGSIGINIADAINHGLLYQTRADAIIRDNVIFDCSSAGIKVGSPSSSASQTTIYNTAVIEGNTIINTHCGIDATWQEDIRNNTIANNEVGIDGGETIEGNLIINNIYGIKGGAEIRSNTIVNNSVGVQSSFRTLVYNNIYNNSEFNVRSLSSDNVNATHNWWGTTNTSAIEQTIYDYYEDFNLGKVSFAPILTEPIPQAPSAQTPLIPEFPSWIILPLFLVATFVVVSIRKKTLSRSYI